MDAFCALVPMRHNSQRVPGKNFRSFAGRPLYHYIVDSLIASDRFASIIIDTDSPVITEDARRCYGDRVQIVPRPPELSAPATPMNSILLYDAARTDCRRFLQTHATNPLLKTETIVRAVETFNDLLSAGTHDSLFSVTRRQVRIWTETGRPMNHDPGVLLQTQDLPPFFEENSCLYLFTKHSLTEHANRIGSRPALFEMDPLEAADIDQEHDFLLAETLYRLRQTGSI